MFTAGCVLTCCGGMTPGAVAANQSIRGASVPGSCGFLASAKIRGMRLSAALLYLTLAPLWLLAQEADAISTSLCEIAKDPPAFDGRLVRVRGTIVSGFEVFTLTDQTCGSDFRIWLDDADSPPSAATEYALISSLAAAKQPEKLTWIAMKKRRPITFKKDAELKKLESYLTKQFKPERGSRCIGCPLYSVTVTITGRFDHSDRRLKAFRDKDSKIVGFGAVAFGHLGAWESRLVMESVSDVAATKIDPSIYKPKQ